MHCIHPAYQYHISASKLGAFLKQKTENEKCCKTDSLLKAIFLSSIFNCSIKSQKSELSSAFPKHLNRPIYIYTRKVFILNVFTHTHIHMHTYEFMKGIYVDVCKKHRACQEAYKSKYCSASRNCQTIV